MTAAGLVRHFAPDPMTVLAQAAQAETRSAAQAKTANAKKSEKTKKTKAERAADMKAEREKQLKEQADRLARETKTFTTGSYLDTVFLRAREFPEKVASDGGFAVGLVGMFLLGAWFVRSGVMEDSAKHLAFFRKLALYGLALGIGLGVLTGLIAISHTPGERHDGWGIARGLTMLGSLPACLGYVGLVVTMLHSRSAWLRRIRVLAPAGRMALTNYLMQSVICMLVFYGFGFGRWGMPRAEQVLFVLVVYAAQVAFSHWWLGRFRYGPMEWVWRGFTYRQMPAMRVGRAAEVVPTQAA
jgi:uncharacterized membrane protein YeiB